MPSTSEAQRRFFGAELGRKRAGQKTDTNLSEQSLRDYASSNKNTRKHKRAAKRHGRKSRRT